VKQAGGKWIKASTVSYFQEHFRLRQSKQAAIDKLGRFHGAWLSKKVFVVCCCVFIVCAASIVGAFFAGRRSSITVDSAPVAEKKITIEEKVEWFKGNAQHSISHDDFSKAMSKGPFYDVPDKDEVISAHQANREFSPIIPIIDSQLVSVCRYYPYETANGPAYRVNLLWGLSANQKRGSILWAKYFRAPN
jgi:hypothetical protein